LNSILTKRRKFEKLVRLIICQAIVQIRNDPPCLNSIPSKRNLFWRTCF